MKIHLAWIRVTAAAAIATIGGPWAVAQSQYAPYATTQPYSNAAPVAPYGVGQTQPPIYPSTSQPSYIPATQERYATTAGTPSARSQYQPPSYQQPSYQQPAVRSPYAALARQTNGTAMPGTSAMPPQQAGNLPSPDAATSGDAMSQGTAQGYSATSPYPSTNGYFASDPGCNNGTCENQDCGVDGYYDGCGGGTQWFGGVYGLVMTRNDPGFQRFTARVDTPAGGYPYYPTADLTVLSTADVDNDYRGGFEVRFGCSLGTDSGCDSDCGSYGYDTCGYGNGGCNSCEQEFAWEVGYWYLDGDVNSAQAFDAIPTDTNRLYGMKNFAGLTYNGRPVNDFYDYEVPVTDPTAPGANDVRVLAQRIRTNFRAQNVELNLWRLPLYGGCGCDAGACGSTGDAFSVMTLCGFRYLRVDDDFEYATMWGIDNGAGVVTPPAFTPWDGQDNELYYDVNVDNNLTGFQLGGNMNYCVSCNCNLFWNSNFGLYNNYITSRQRAYGELGPATWTQSGENMTVRSNKDDVAFVGEMLLGGSYDFTCHWRASLAYRAVAVSGLALSNDQIPEDFANEPQTILIDSDGSIIIHGVQAGIECRY